MITTTNAQNWKTPQQVFDALHREYAFTIDGAASIRNHKLPRYWTKAHNALRLPWSGERVFYNPPFRMAGEFIAKAIEERDRNGVFSVGLMLCSVETAWFHEIAINAEKHLFRRRVCYEPPPGVDASQPSFGSMLVICDPNGGSYPTGLYFSRVRDGATGEYWPEQDTGLL